MSHKTVDCRGLSCPQPVITTKKALDADNELLVLVDNGVAKENVIKFAASQGCHVCTEEAEGIFHIHISRDSAKVPEKGPTEKQDKREQVFLITRETLGHGSDELGAVLMKAFVLSLLESKPLPQAIMFINSGVKLTVDGSPVLNHIKGLADQGVEILSCGTCLDYYCIKDKLAVGRVTNMYTIVEKLYTGRAVTI